MDIIRIAVKVQRLFFIAVLSFISLAYSQEIITGPASVIDGDTIRIEQTKIRLLGIDAPDKGKTAQSAFYEQSKQTLATFIGQRQVTCRPTGDKSYDRIVAKCYLGKVDLAAYIVMQGLAVDWPRHSNGEYADEMQLARQKKLGMWQTLNKSWR